MVVPVNWPEPEIARVQLSAYLVNQRVSRAELGTDAPAVALPRLASQPVGERPFHIASRQAVAAPEIRFQDQCLSGLPSQRSLPTSRVVLRPFRSVERACRVMLWRMRGRRGGSA